VRSYTVTAHHAGRAARPATAERVEAPAPTTTEENVSA
jgi:hypothetical protein